MVASLLQPENFMRLPHGALQPPSRRRRTSTRLVWEVTHSHRTHGWLVLQSGSVSYGKATAYLPVVDLLKAYCRIEDQDEPRAMREKLTGKLLTLDKP